MSITAYNVIFRVIKEHDDLRKIFEEKTFLHTVGAFSDTTAIIEDCLNSLNNVATRDFIRSLIYISESINETPLFKKCLERAAAQGFIPALELMQKLRVMGIYDNYALIRGNIVYDWSPQS